MTYFITALPARDVIFHCAWHISTPHYRIEMHSMPVTFYCRRKWRGKPAHAGMDNGYGEFGAQARATHRTIRLQYRLVRSCDIAHVRPKSATSSPKRTQLICPAGFRSGRIWILFRSEVRSDVVPKNLRITATGRPSVWPSAVKCAAMKMSRVVDHGGKCACDYDRASRALRSIARWNRLAFISFCV